ncbi:MAG: GNAT family N-acetyltransferase [Oscillospiraceae bacterium]|jgi:ribosomal protein S18 acetylase RimI-like enzyme|nr:GNAT family N-acetyltransferase [Oscillospiraceae bacterium]
MAYAEPLESGHYLFDKVNQHTGELEAKAGVISALAGEIWREHYTPLIGEEQVAYMLIKYQSPKQIVEDIRSHNYTYFTAKRVKTEDLVGYCACQPREGHLFLSKIYVRSDHRGNGISRSFLEEAIALCRRVYTLDRIRLTVNKHNGTAITVYKKWGFTVADSVKTDIGEGFFMDDYVMELRLEPLWGGRNA